MSMCSCKVCGVQKVRKNGARTPNGRRFYKVDDVGRRWNGATCPQCRGHEVGVRLDEIGPDFGPKDVLYPPKLRPCQSCKTPSPNYYDCNDCRSTKAIYGCYDEYSGSALHLPYSGSFKAGFAY